MSSYIFFECTNPSCGLRFPLDVESHRGAYCPRCGAPLKKAVSAVSDAKGEPGSVEPRRRLCGVLDNIRSALNVGAIFRTADGVGMERLFLCGITPTPEDTPTVEKTALGAQKTMQWSVHANVLVLGQSLIKQGYVLLALETTDEALFIHDIPVNAYGGGPLALIVGNERAGVDPGLLKLCEGVIALPMVGRKASLNVAVAFGVAAYWLSYRIRN